MGFLKEYYEQIVELQESEWDFIASHFERKVVTKMKLSPSRGNRKLSVFYRIRYCTFYIPEEEEANELTFNFSFDKELTCAYDSF